ncbi:hypothetical protein [Pseudodesulfovibrio senegalensis]|uniref:HipA-like C-terminal domain-containing protein n=1 Tax=Pseudodesulfovibrio senegalensis TaxID=1721087 RepID=A0A6N6N1N6_9BACT|nr:hypothetical protein [Pseudodesulfovibrio senegalensis]KAB1439008.1 hypothetical protein F8A88_14920 [Pseudodesulfovibrio senegalensis]
MQVVMFSLRRQDTYPIIGITKNQWDLEPQGTLDKFWVEDNKDGKRYLFKAGRPHTCQNTAEMVASKICETLGIPHAYYDFSISDGTQGVISSSFLLNGGKEGRLIFGNELLEKAYDDYDATKRYKLKAYTLRRTAAFFSAISRPNDSFPLYPCNPNDPSYRAIIDEELTASDMFLSYLMLDALIGNLDRHHENWGLIVDTDKNMWLAPTYDHASSLGHNLLDHDREGRLVTKDSRRSVEAFVKRAKSAFYEQGKRCPSLCCFCLAAARLGPERANYWRNKLELLTDDELDLILRRVPSEFASDISLHFMYEMIKCNKKRILEVEYGNRKEAICCSQGCPK